MEQKTKRLLYLTFGWLMFTLGFIGAFLPVLPTTPLMILALWGFSRGSETLHNWLYNHPKFGPALQDWDKNRMIPVKAKITAITMMTISGAYLVLLSGAPNIAIICGLGLMAYGAIYILTKPNRIEEPQYNVDETAAQNNEAKLDEPPTPPQAP